MFSKATVILNVISFELLWWASVSSAELGIMHWVTLLVAAFVLAHLKYVEGWQQIGPLLLTAVVGAVFDQFGYSMGWVSFNYHTQLATFIPLWMVSLWLAFACTLNVSMAWLMPKPILAALLGAVFGPISYMIASRLGVVNFPHGPLSLAWISLEWAILMPLLLTLRARLNQRTWFNKRIN